MKAQAVAQSNREWKAVRFQYTTENSRTLLSLAFYAVNNLIGFTLPTLPDSSI